MFDGVLNTFFRVVYSSALLIPMIDNQESAITDPRADLQNFSNRKDAAFQYGDQLKQPTDVRNRK